MSDTQTSLLNKAFGAILAYKAVPSRDASKRAAYAAARKATEDYAAYLGTSYERACELVMELVRA